MVLTSDRRRADQTATSNVSFGSRKAELTRDGGVGLRGVEHGRAQVRRRGVVHLEEEERKHLRATDGAPPGRRVQRDFTRQEA
ncbi:hypothetical protein EYF80_067343 [Liparis tanakae]|uniref:Uncharacterized protein n=1 Tax=Liparis tanakae TaxID=230148 RepID=A0A4Z2E1A7_9TELE|nr:hypothetical protein EYF80_067343 [Liparis tanakae]